VKTWDEQGIADKLMELADLLEQQGVNPFRLNAYRHLTSLHDPPGPGGSQNLPVTAGDRRRHRGRAVGERLQHPVRRLTTMGISTGSVDVNVREAVTSMKRRHPGSECS
jgi:hypothetical protein